MMMFVATTVSVPAVALAAVKDRALVPTVVSIVDTTVTPADGQVNGETAKPTGGRAEPHIDNVPAVPMERHVAYPCMNTENVVVDDTAATPVDSTMQPGASAAPYAIPKVMAFVFATAVHFRFAVILTVLPNVQ